MVIAVFNSAESHVVSGFSEALDIFVAAARRDGIRTIKLNVDQGLPSACSLLLVSADVSQGSTVRASRRVYPLSGLGPTRVIPYSNR